MSSAIEQDPFLQVQTDVLSTLDETRPLFASYLRIRSLAASPSSAELIQARTELESTLKELSSDLQDLVASVKAVENDPYRYGLDVEEVERRRQLVKDVGDEVGEMRFELSRAATEKDHKKGKATGVNNNRLPSPDEFEDVSAGHDDYAAFEQQRQLELMHEQDEALDGVFRTVGNLRQQADDMGRELEEQAEMLDDVDNLADRVGGKLQNGVKKIGWLIRKNEDTMSSCCIAILIFVLILLLVIVIVV